MLIDGEEDPRRSCYPKRRFPVEGTAIKAARKVNESPDRDHEVVAYGCRFCGGWHIGRKPRNPKV